MVLGLSSISFSHTRVHDELETKACIQFSFQRMRYKARHVIFSILVFGCSINCQSHQSTSMIQMDTLLDFA